MCHRSTKHGLILSNISIKCFQYAHLEKARGVFVEITDAQLARFKKFVDDLRKMITVRESNEERQERLTIGGSVAIKIRLPTLQQNRRPRLIFC